MDLEALREKALEGKFLDEDSLIHVCWRVKMLLLDDSNIARIEGRVVVCGDVHGQFWDLLRVLELGGPVNSTKYLFLVRTSLLMIFKRCIKNSEGRKGHC